MMEHSVLNESYSADVGASEFCRNKVVPTLRSSGLYHCPQCNQGFKQRSNAQSHFKSVHLNVKKQCTHCGQYFKKLKSHIQDVHAMKKWIPCNVCGKEYQEGRLFKDHMNKTHFQDEEGNPHEMYLETTSCDVCGKHVLKSRFERHMRLRHYLPPNFAVECPICGAHVKFLPWHLQKFHKHINYSKNMHRCDRCSQWFLKKEDLEEHLIDHEEYFCVDCLINLETHLKLAKHMYSVHKKVFNVGKRFKLGKNQWDNSCASAVTYHIEKPSGQVNIDPDDIPAVKHDLSSITPFNGNGRGQESNVIDHELLDTLEEESFTVVLDEKGNLQNVILNNNDEVKWRGISAFDKNFEVAEIGIESASNTANLNLNFSAQTLGLDVEQHPDSISAKPEEESEKVFTNICVPVSGKALNTSDATPDQKVSVLEEGAENESEVQEYEVEIDGNTNTFQIIIPSERFMKYKTLLSEKDNLIKFIQENLPQEYKDVGKDFTFKENKLHERFETSKKYLPRSLIGVELSPEDEEVLIKAPKVENISSKDLMKYQIGKREDIGNTSNKYQACPSRQAHLCPYCRQVLKTRNSLSRHISVVHLDEKKFDCSDCDKHFATKADLVKHKKATHEEDKNELIACDICNEKFKVCYLKRHKYYKHTPNNLPKHCNECGKEFKTREIMLKHVKKIHLKQRDSLLQETTQGHI
eukprot:GFUD01020969.1.p1 GENE.GFUD01020969.1~~GFUD01020969.1.p1  ORF type:complete len:694 (+),score=147.76 GFUD01020969.1:33-2114(+)